LLAFQGCGDVHDRGEGKRWSEQRLFGGTEQSVSHVIATGATSENPRKG